MRGAGERARDGGAQYPFAADITLDCCEGEAYRTTALYCCEASTNVVGRFVSAALVAVVDVATLFGVCIVTGATSTLPNGIGSLNTKRPLPEKSKGTRRASGKLFVASSLRRRAVADKTPSGRVPDVTGIISKDGADLFGASCAAPTFGMKRGRAKRGGAAALNSWQSSSAEGGFNGLDTFSLTMVPIGCACTSGVARTSEPKPAILLSSVPIKIASPRPNPSMLAT